MPTPRSRLRPLLVQIRDIAEAEQQEQRCFVERCGIAPEQLEVYNVIRQPRIRPRDVEHADVLFVGGAGAHSVTENYDFTEPLAEVVRWWVEDGRPFFGSCWGHQFLAQVLGGRVETLEDRAEIGTFEVALTSRGKQDELLREMPERFRVQLGHKDHVTSLPEGVSILASSDWCEAQLLRVGGKPAYASQFHCEMSEEDMRWRARLYQKLYFGDEQAVREFERTLSPSPEADAMLARFLDLFT